MADNNGLPLETIADRLKNLGLDHYECPICKGKEFSVQSFFAVVNVTEKKDTPDLKSFVPSVMLICTKCGHMDLFAYSILEKK